MTSPGSEWPNVLLDSVARRGSGHTPKKGVPAYWNGGIPWISLQDSQALDRLAIHETAVEISAVGLANSSARLHPRGTVVLSRDAGVGKSTILARDMAVSQHFIAWTCGPQLHNAFLYFLLQHRKPEFERIAIGSTIQTIGLPYFESYEIPLPPLHEQQAIAAALSDADGVVAGLERVIAKKRLIKQGAMQDFLTARRLPGFSGEWEKASLGSVLRRSPSYGINAPAMPRGTGGFAYLRITDIDDDGKVDPSGLPSVRESASDHYLLSAGDIVVARTGASVGKSHLFRDIGEPVIFAGFLIRLCPDETKIMPSFLSQYMRTERYWDWVRKNSARSGQPGVNGQQLRMITFQLPNIDEQQAIAAVLSDMDAEIQTLESRLTKAKAVKVGMMQNLLTGRVRLV
ncbi:restriction endonuclease subunit S [Pseudotabrizicola sediminis]|uniref:Restriction endonuclease subunit S n=1 Tax=Pseudotabrizicola sediminis TaxID=2486418 RepID=A0ABY2KI71_9RHOB|nr:restriction endonuclease subunit S [Pseudotabrizicola sediminis]TGD41352.1 restriction endonuclease subunit S [Pseudotabrizicola sediminis]